MPKCKCKVGDTVERIDSAYKSMKVGSTAVVKDVRYSAGDKKLEYPSEILLHDKGIWWYDADRFQIVISKEEINNHYEIY